MNIIMIVLSIAWVAFGVIAIWLSLRFPQDDPKTRSEWISFIFCSLFMLLLGALAAMIVFACEDLSDASGTNRMQGKKNPRW